MAEDGLCCCEYINEKGERSHIIAALCNCEAIDEAFERLITWKSMRPGLIKEILSTIEDRFRIPYPGGAKKINATVFLPFLLNFFLIILGSINYGFTVITYLIILPLTVFACHRLFKSCRVDYLCEPKKYSKSNLNKNLKFYTVWVASTGFYLLLIYYFLIISSLKISSVENFLFLLLFVSMCTSFYIVVKKGKILILSSANIAEDTLQCLETCSECPLKFTRPLSHCKICGVCYEYRDHHCLWLNICIGRTNDRWFVAALLLCVTCLLYGAQLTFTTICHPRYLYIGSFKILYPYECLNAYFDYSSSIMYSGGCYILVLMACVTFLLMQQIYLVSCGLRRPSQKYTSRKTRSIICQLFFNWYSFWKG